MLGSPLLLNQAFIMDTKIITVSRPVAWLIILFIIKQNQVRWQRNTTSLVTANQIPVRAFTIQTIFAQAASDNRRHVLAMGLQGYQLQDTKYGITLPLWKRLMYQQRPLMIPLNWNSFSLTTSDSLNSSSCDVFRIDQSTILEQGTFHAADPASGVCGLRDKGIGESRAGTLSQYNLATLSQLKPGHTGNELRMTIFQIQRGKTGLIDLGMKKA